MIWDAAARLKLVLGLATFVAAGAACVALDNYQLQVGASLAMFCALCWAWNIVGGYMGYPSLATATFFGLGAYVDAILQVQGVPLLGAWVLAALGGGVLAAILGAALLRLKGHYFAIGTIATVEVLQEIANNWSAVTGGADGINLPIQEGSPESVGRFFYLAMLALALIAFVAALLVDRSRFGFGLRCIRQNEPSASMVGIDVFKYKVGAFVLSSALCAAAGAVYASMVAFIEPKDAFNLIVAIEIPVMVMLGGMGTIIGPFVGGVFYVVLKEFVWANFLDWHSGVLGLIIVAVIYFLPGGVLGLGRRFMKRPPERNPAAEALP